MLTRIVEGRGEEDDLDKLLDVANKIEGHTICAAIPFARSATLRRGPCRVS
jgi:NADH:ubiquinone oxidoreductase subunit F (NADH-binding)